jgi:hypothetical protein
MQVVPVQLSSSGGSISSSSTRREASKQEPSKTESQAVAKTSNAADVFNRDKRWVLGAAIGIWGLLV